MTTARFSLGLRYRWLTAAAYRVIVAGFRLNGIGRVELEKYFREERQNL